MSLVHVLVLKHRHGFRIEKTLIFAGFKTNGSTVSGPFSLPLIGGRFNPIQPGRHFGISISERFEVACVKGLFLEKGALAFRDDLPVPKPMSGEALVRVRLAGICGTDLELVKGYVPFTGVLGHEFVGEVVEAQDSVWMGSSVVGEITIAWRSCPMCQAGLPGHCDNRAVAGILDHQGAFAEYLVLPLRNLHKIPEPVSDEAAVFAEPLAAALEIQNQVSIQSGHRVLIVGAGRLGQLIAQTLSITGCDLQVVARHETQRAALGARDIATIPETAVPSREMDVVVEATGSPEGFALARNALRPRGIMALKSTYQESVNVNLSSIVVDEITLVGSRCGPFGKALALLESGAVDPTPLITARYNLEDGLKAFERAVQPGALKVLLEP
jgi:2-desacetyl-2-hydroxyethyl bacteriochlorophyllide A dehydrogenase